MRFVVLGAGLMGRAALYDLAQSDVASEIVVADYHLNRARDTAERFGAGKCQASFADVRQIPDLANLLRDAAVVLNCTQYYWNVEVMRAAIDAGVHYLDLGGLFHITRKQMELDSEFRRIGKLALLGMGGTPGISNIAARFLADQLERIESIRIYDGSTDLNASADPLSWSFSIATILDELTQEPSHFIEGSFHSVPPLSGEERAIFPSPIGAVTVRHSIHSEVATLPLSFRDKGVREVFFKINYDPALIESIKLLRAIGLLEREPVRVNEASVSPRALLEELLKSRNAATTEVRDVETIRVVVTGSKSGKPRRLKLDVTAHHSDTPKFSAVARTTGFPAAIAALMIANGEIDAVGVRAPEEVVTANDFLRELERREMTVAGSGWPITRAVRKAKAA